MGSHGPRRVVAGLKSWAGSLFHTRALALACVAFAGCAADVADPASGESVRMPAPPQEIDVSEAALVVVGSAGKSSAQWSEKDEGIVTITEFDVEEVQRGNASGVLRIKSLGGTMGDQGRIVSHQPRFFTQQRSRLYLVPGADGTYSVLGGQSGQQSLASAGRKEGVSEQSQALSICGSGFCQDDRRPSYPWQKMPIPFYIKNNLASGWFVGDPATIVPAIRAGFDSWESEGASAMEWSYQGLTDADSVTGAWVVSFQPLSGATGLTDIQLSRANSGPWTITATVMRLNSQVCWRTDGGNGLCPNGNPNLAHGPYDVQHVATHESGHALGLDDIDDTNQVMNFRYQNKRSLGPGDIAGVRAIYPSGWSDWQRLPDVAQPLRIDATTTFPNMTGGKGKLVVGIYNSGKFLLTSTRPANANWGFWTSVPGLGAIDGVGPTMFTSSRSVPPGTLADPRGTPAMGFGFIGAGFALNPASGKSENLGGPIASAPSGLPTANRGVHYVAKGTDGALWYFGCSPATSACTGTKGWFRVNGDKLGSDPRIISLSSSKALVIATSPTRDLMFTWLNNGAFDSWATVVRGAFLLGGPAGAARSSTRVEIVARSQLSTLQTIKWDASTGWGNWTAIDNTPVVADPAATSWGANRFDVFAIHGDGVVYHKRNAN